MDIIREYHLGLLDTLQQRLKIVEGERQLAQDHLIFVTSKKKVDAVEVDLAQFGLGIESSAVNFVQLEMKQLLLQMAFYGVYPEAIRVF